MGDKKTTCNFCGASDKVRNFLISSKPEGEENNVYICDKCIETCALIICAKRQEERDKIKENE